MIWSSKKRYRRDKDINLSIIKVWVFEDGSIAYNLEQLIISDNRKFKYAGEAILKGGNSELFNIDILNLLDYKEMV